MAISLKLVSNSSLSPVSLPSKKLRELIQEDMKARHYSYRTEETYWAWIKRYILFHQKRHPHGPRIIRT